MKNGFISALTEEEISIIEEKIGYSFKDKRLLSKAFTHSSYVNENKGSVSNERLEFLGDRVLNLICAEDLFFNNAGDEGKLSVLLKNQASAAPLKKSIEDLKLNNFLKTSVGLDFNQSNSKAISDLYEAIVAAIYVDSGNIDMCRRFVKMSLKSIDIHDYISILKEWCEKNKKQIDKSSRETHKNEQLIYVCEIEIDGKSFCGEGRKIKDAERLACGKACEFFGI